MAWIPRKAAIVTGGRAEYLERQVDDWRDRHGWRPGLIWSPSAWRTGARCGCPKPCGAYVRRGEETRHGR